ncbi:glycoside hydrolase [Mucilaginibacter terrigena]|uniref:Glycoside hydrolase n=1 Tax=Mucilaginibacter terrigena TaxID=2492395 RepID=A0A4Q5LMP8_9SPHI|nr:glycosyl hydrolase [Mucilaginibacter terrigena]RYU90897.1 glycoside hydrolase [Mucilaginibacter terrigena]
MKKRYFPLVCLVAVVVLFSIIRCGKDGGNNITPVKNDPPAVVVDPPVVPNTPFKSLKYLYSITGTKTLSGIHNREPNTTPKVWTDKAYNVTGKYPALWSGDFLFQEDNINNRQVMINEAEAQFKKGAIVNIMWHSCNPALAEPCGFDASGVKSKLTDAQWADLLTDGTAINTQWKNLVDEVCVYLQQLKDKNVEVLWRPYHEMNQGAFWWGGRPGPNGTRKLYQQLHNYMTNTKGLTNLVWVWDMQDFGTLESDMNSYNPGADYWDIAALDFYDGSGYTAAKYNIMVAAAKGKPIAIGECDKLPTAAQLSAQPKWTFFMSWSELTFSANTDAQVKALYTSPNVVNLDKMPGW